MQVIRNLNTRIQWSCLPYACSVYYTVLLYTIVQYYSMRLPLGICALPLSACEALIVAYIQLIPV